MHNKMIPNRLDGTFFKRDVLDVAPNLLGKIMVRTFNDGSTQLHVITETEAYRGEEDLACHASKGRTARTEVMFHSGGLLYVYKIYGIHWMLNVVCGLENNPQASLIRGLQRINGPGRLTKALQIDKTFYGEDLSLSQRIFMLDDGGDPVSIRCTPRIGIDYAGDIWKNKPWRFVTEY